MDTGQLWASAPRVASVALWFSTPGAGGIQPVGNRMPGSSWTVWLPSKFKPTKTGTGSFAPAGRYIRIVIAGPPATAENCARTCFRTAVPASALQLTDSVWNDSDFGSPGLRP